MVIIPQVAAETHGHVGADLASLCSEAALQQVCIIHVLDDNVFAVVTGLSIHVLARFSNILSSVRFHCNAIEMLVDISMYLKYTLVFLCKYITWYDIDS